MEIKYKEALQDIRKSIKTPSSSFQTPWIYPGVDLNASRVQREIIAADPSVKSEKVEILESLNEFSSDKLAMIESFKFEGGEIKRKAQGPNIETITSSASIEELAKSLQEALGDDLYSARFKNKKLVEKCQVIFVTDEYMLESGPESELTSFFDSEVAQLFGRMVGAMGLVESDFYVSAIKSPNLDTDQSRNLLFDELHHLAPRFVVTLGAIATNSFLGDQQRLKNIHGKLFDFSLRDQTDKLREFKVMPLFSPKLLHTAPNMKKTAWKDMQILMELL